MRRLLEGRCLFQYVYPNVRRLFEAQRLLEEIWYSESLVNTLYTKNTKHKTQMLRKNSFEQNKRCIECSFFSFASSNLSQFYRFTFSSQFLYELKHKVHLSRCVYGIYHFFFLSLYFCLIKNMDSLTLKRHNSFQKKTATNKKINKYKSRTNFCSQTSDF